MTRRDLLRVLAGLPIVAPILSAIGMPRPADGEDGTALSGSINSTVSEHPYVVRFDSSWGLIATGFTADRQQHFLCPDRTQPFSWVSDEVWYSYISGGLSGPQKLFRLRGSVPERYLRAGRPQVYAAIRNSVAPKEIMDGFLRQYGDVTKAVDNNLTIESTDGTKLVTLNNVVLIEISCGTFTPSKARCISRDGTEQSVSGMAQYDFMKFLAIEMIDHTQEAQQPTVERNIEAMLESIPWSVHDRSGPS